jgi:hypothetical protein
MSTVFGGFLCCVRRAFYLNSVGSSCTLPRGSSTPVVLYITRAQRKIGEMELWGGLLYPLFYALCNVLLLPAGIPAIGSGLFLDSGGIFLNLTGNLAGAAMAFVISRKLAPLGAA